MADTLLILYNPDNKDQLQWGFVNDQGTPDKLTYGSITELSNIARGYRATLLLNSSHVNLTQVKIPSQNRQRQLQAIPYALEDQLADDIDDLHFAAGKKQADDNIPVITINRALLDHLTQDFKNAGVFIDTLSADVLALPFNNNQWTLLIDNQRALIRTGHFTGFYCDLNIVPVFLQALINQQESSPELLHIYVPEHLASEVESLKITDLEINLEIIKESVFSIFARNLSSARQLNILQGTYTPKRESSGLIKPWKSVAAIFVAWLVLQLIYAGFESYQLENQNRELAGLIQKEFKKANPEANKYNNMRKRMENKLKEARGGGDNKDDQLFLQLLSDATPAFINNQKITINGMVFRNKFIDIDLQADSLQTLEAVKTKLTTIPGLKTVISTSVEKDKVKGRLRLETQG